VTLERSLSLILDRFIIVLLNLTASLDNNQLNSNNYRYRYYYLHWKMILSVLVNEYKLYYLNSNPNFNYILGIYIYVFKYRFYPVLSHYTYLPTNIYFTELLLSHNNRLALPQTISIVVVTNGLRFKRRKPTTSL